MGGDGCVWWGEKRGEGEGDGRMREEGGGGRGWKNERRGRVGGEVQ